MQTYHYQIILSVPLGHRHGTMTLQVQEYAISGELFLLEKHFALSGNIIEKNECQIFGKFCSPKQEYQYSAVGTFTATEIQLLLTVGQRRFRLSGIAYKPSESL